MFSNMETRLEMAVKLQDLDQIKNSLLNHRLKWKWPKVCAKRTEKKMV